MTGEGPFSFRADVVRNTTTSERRVLTWRASVNGVSVADGLPDEKIAKEKIAAELESGMRAALPDWEIFRRK